MPGTKKKTTVASKSKSEDVDFYNQHEGNTGRQFGVYLDEEENVAAEETRAFREGREPDFETATVSAGTPLVTKAVLDQTISPSSVNVPNADDQLVDPEPLETLPVDRAGIVERVEV